MVVENKRAAIMNKLQQAQHEIASLRACLSVVISIAMVIGIAGVVMAFELLSMYDAIEGIC
ncbi:hypothetical protein S349_36 [Shewanella sp. phage 3/49]|uniref:hypothetical protein n=1 Tax=Shewanella sp. phage 3/49 TaxID=1458863 RepID=UPI0004F8FA2D|nr:hypothetical protein S349_36 [Shewanella sp. phage 3/49]AHK11826.1 hypothetical protein S349_36 [Shewanella sp. phage 3/49]